MTIDMRILAQNLRTFSDERDWAGFHSPKNLAMALAGEVGELLSELQWLTAEESESSRLSAERRAAVEGELADILIYFTLLVDRLDIDLERVVASKMAANRDRFPPAG